MRTHKFNDWLLLGPDDHWDHWRLPICFGPEDVAKNRPYSDIWLFLHPGWNIECRDPAGQMRLGRGPAWFRWDNEEECYVARSQQPPNVYGMSEYLAVRT